MKAALGNPLFIFLVIIPSVLAAVYYGVVASDVFISESSFVVRSTQPTTAPSIGLLLKDVGLSRAAEDAYAVQYFILSRDALRTLIDDPDLRVDQAFGRGSIDTFDRFGGIGRSTSFEALFRYYSKKVSAPLDSTSSIINVTTRAFTAHDAFEMDEHLLAESEELVNKLNERARGDMVRFAESEVASAKRVSGESAQALAQYRNEQQFFELDKQAAVPLQLVSKLQDELIAAKSELGQLKLLANRNPQIPTLELRITMLQHELEKETARIAGSGGNSYAGKAVEYQRLAMEKEFADKLLASAMVTLEAARTDAVKKQLYLERIVQPSLPDIPEEPRRIKGFAVTLIVALMVFGIVNLIVQGAREHHD